MEGKKSKKILIKWLSIIVVILLFVGIGVYIFLTHRTYDKVRVLSTVALERENGEKYVKFWDGILKYSKDGVCLLYTSDAADD